MGGDPIAYEIGWPPNQQLPEGYKSVNMSSGTCSNFSILCTWQTTTEGCVLKILEGALVIAGGLFPALLLTACVVSSLSETAPLNDNVYWLWFALIAWVVGYASSEYVQKERGK